MLSNTVYIYKKKNIVKLRYRPTKKITKIIETVKTRTKYGDETPERGRFSILCKKKKKIRSCKYKNRKISTEQRTTIM